MIRSLLVLALLSLPGYAANDLYEIKILWAAEGKLDALHGLLKDHILKANTAAGIDTVGVWVPLDNKDNRVVILSRYEGYNDMDEEIAKVTKDAEVGKAVEAAGKPIAKKASVLIWSPGLKLPLDFKPAKGKAIIELRTYVTTPGKRLNLEDRFRDHTVKLFEKHGMTNLGYFVRYDTKGGKVVETLPGLAPAGAEMPEEPKDGFPAENVLVYFLAHESDDARKKSFDAFRADPIWVAARKASEEKAGGSLTAKNGVISLVMKPADYSPAK